MTCPSCKGSGKGGMAFVTRTARVQIGLTTAMIPRCNVEPVRCSTCVGTGEVSDHYPEWKERGEQMKHDRRSRDMSLRDEAKRLGIGVAQLSAMEHGRIEPLTHKES